MEAGRTGGKGGVCGYWLQLIPDGNLTVQLFWNTQLCPSSATSWSRSQPSLDLELPFCKDLGGELSGRVPILQLGTAGVRWVGKDYLLSSGKFWRG